MPHTHMTTLHLYAEAAILRDLSRARALLTTRIRLSSERRRALTDHLTWLATLFLPGTEQISPAAAAMRDSAAAFGADGIHEDRIRLVGAIDALVAATRNRPGRWTAEDVPRVACGNLPWVLDEVPLRGGPVLVLPRPEDPEAARQRAAEYRRMRARLWGPVALVPAGLLA